METKNQTTMNTFNFMYFTDDLRSGNSIRHKNIDSKNIDFACKKFLRWMDKLISRKVAYVDYEVEVNGSYIDISEQKGFENLI